MLADIEPAVTIAEREAAGESTEKGEEAS